MACGYGLPDPEDCAADHWCGKLRAERSPGAKEWRGPCPVPKCPTTDDRLLVFGVWGKGVRVVNSFCPHHDKDAVRAIVRGLVGDCAPGKPDGPAPVDRDALIELALSEMPPTSLRLAMLELAGMSTPDALDKLGIRRENRSRVISGRASKLMQKPR